MSSNIWNSRGLACSILDKLKGIKAGATWKKICVLRKFDILGLYRICMSKEKGHPMSNVEFL